MPPPWLAGPHRQTIASHFLRRCLPLPAPEDRLFSVEPEVQLLARCHWQADRSRALTVVIVHGLEGSSESQYVRGNAAKAWAAGMNVVRLNQRNCGGSEKLAPSLYHSGLSSDVGGVVRALISEDRLPRVALVGYSMGGNLVLKCAGEWGREAPPQLQAVAAVSPGMDLSVSTDLLHRGFNRLYEWNFLWSLRRRLRLKAVLFPGRYDLARLRGLRSIRDFDDRITAFYCGFQGAEDYYRRASAAPWLERISVPTLVIHAKDDPFIAITPQTRARLLANPNIRYLETEHGGHCAFLARRDGAGDDGRWAERQILAFLKQFS